MRNSLDGLSRPLHGTEEQKGLEDTGPPKKFKLKLRKKRRKKIRVCILTYIQKQNSSLWINIKQSNMCKLSMGEISKE